MKHAILIALLVMAGCGYDFHSKEHREYARGYENGKRAGMAYIDSLTFRFPSLSDSVDLIETREDIVYRIFDDPTGERYQHAMNGADFRRATRNAIDLILKRDFATWPMASGAKKGSGGILNSGGPSDTTGAGK